MGARVVGSGAALPAARRRSRRIASARANWRSKACAPMIRRAGQRLARALGVELDSLVRMRQVHCADVFEAAENGVRASDRYDDWPEADIAVTDDPSVAAQRESGRLRADSARRSPNRRGCGGSCRLEGHCRGRGDGGRSVARRRDTAAKPDDVDRRRRSEHRPVLLRGRSRSRGAIFVASGGADDGSREMRSRISICGAPRAISSRARAFRRSRFTCARCARSTIPRCSIPTAATARVRAGSWRRLEVQPGRTP